MRFSEREVRDLLLSWIVLSISFAILWENGVIGILSRRSELFTNPFLIPKMLVIVGSAFVLHELAHKYVAQKYGLWAEYRKWNQGLLLAFFLSLTGLFLFAAPGAVMIMSGFPDPKIEVKTSIAGPISNIGVGIVALFLRIGGILPVFMTQLAVINFFLAMFNMFPIPPMDGSKVFRYNPTTWIIIFGAAIVLLFFTW
ncbi:MAG: site-2 protease family protein [Candidatus Methanofastidiosia archaeon]|jgi:Zn-dependent protease